MPDTDGTLSADSAVARSTLPGDPAPGLVPDERRGGRLPSVVYVLAAVIFLMGTTEFMVAGLLPGITSGLHVSVSRAGLLITAFAAGMIVGAPVMSMATLRIPRRFALILALAVFAAGHVAAALSSSFWFLFGSRFITAIAVGAFWAVGSAVATEAAGPQARARAMGAMVGGLTLANVIGVPLGTFIGDGLGWRGPFWILAVLAVMAMPLIAKRVRPVSEQGGLSVRAELAEMRQGRVWVVYLAAALLEAALFGAYSYVSPLLTARAGLPEKFIPLVLLGFGAGALLGTVAGGRWGDHHPFATAIPAGALTACVLAATALWATSIPVAVTLVVLLGAAGFTLAPVLVSQALHAASGAPTLATALATSAFNTGNAGGSWICGIALTTSLGLRGPAVAGFVLAVASLAPLALLAAGRPAPRHSRD